MMDPSRFYLLPDTKAKACVRCPMRKKSRLVGVKAGNWSKLLCNGCFGLLQSRKT